MQYGTYIGLTPVTYYGCVLCQRVHRLGLDAEYGPHLRYQSKHGVQTRAPAGPAETFAANLLADGGSPHVEG